MIIINGGDEKERLVPHKVLTSVIDGRCSNYGADADDDDGDDACNCGSYYARK